MKILRDKDGKFIKGTEGYKPWLNKKRGEESIEWKKKISNSLMGKKKSLSHREAISKATVGKKNPAYKNGKTVVRSEHILVLAPEHPFANVNKRVYEHRLVVEKHIGRYLKPYESVHHIDGIPSNNNITNLFLTTRSGNSKAHNSFNKLIKGFLDDRIIIFNKRKGIYEKRN